MPVPSRNPSDSRVEERDRNLGWIGRRLGRIVEHNAAERVADGDLRPWTFFAAIQIGTAICVPTFALGGELGSHSRFIELAPAVIVAALIIAVLAVATGYVGMKARVPTAVLTRNTFGRTGAKVLAAILIVTLLGWFGIQTEMLARALVGLLHSQFGIDVPILPITIAGGALISTTGIIGFRALGKLAYFAVPFLLMVITVPLWIAFGTHDVPARLAAPALATPYDFGMIVSIIAGGHMTAITTTPDVSRFLRTPRDVVFGPLVSLGIALPFLLLLSASLSVIYGTGDLVGIMIAAGLAAPALIILVLATWSSNDKNLYESALSLSALLPGYPRWLLTAGAAIVGIGFAAFGVFAHFIAFLIFMGLLIAPVAGVYTVDFLLGPERYVTGSDDAPRFRPFPFVAWAFGTFVGWATLPAASAGLGIWRLTNVPALDALLAATLSYGLIMLVHRQRRVVATTA